jgi:hypothetical protein
VALAIFKITSGLSPDYSRALIPGTTPASNIYKHKIQIYSN